MSARVSASPRTPFSISITCRYTSPPNGLTCGDTPRHAVQTFRAACARDAIEPGAERLVRARPGEQSARQRPVVEPGAADEDRQATAGVDVADRPRGIFRELRGSVNVAGIGNV